MRGFYLFINAITLRSHAARLIAVSQTWKYSRRLIAQILSRWELGLKLQICNQKTRSNVIFVTYVELLESLIDV